MFKFMKYEIRGTYKFVLATILIVAFATVGIQYTALNTIDSLESGGLSLLNIMLPILSIVIMAASIAFIVYIVQSFRKELYEDRGYLTFTLPLSGRKILGAKVLTAGLWSFLFGSLVLGLNIVVFNSMFGGEIFSEITSQFRYIFGQIGGGFIAGMTIYSLIGSLVTLLIAYFSITVSKVAIKNRQIGGLWILLFMALQTFFNFIEGKIVSILPFYVGLGIGNEIEPGFNLMASDAGWAVDVITGNTSFPISAVIYWIVIGVGLFLATSYLLERKIEL